MGAQTLTGTRIRQHRLRLGLRQAELAARAGISPSYLNLIEHNRRNIAGKLLGRLADVLGTDPELLHSGARVSLLEALRDIAPEAARENSAANAVSLDEVVAQIDELAVRFPEWAGLIVAQRDRIRGLEQAVSDLNDRLTHDPVLAEKMHEVVSTVSAIRSTSAILAGTPDLDKDWQSRFSRNIDAESRRLAKTSAQMVAHFDRLSRQKPGVSSALEQIFSVMDDQAHHIAALEGPVADIEQVVAAFPALDSAAARQSARQVFFQYRADAEAMPLVDFERAVARLGVDPAALSRRFEVPLQAVFRRLASLPRRAGLPDVGLVSCDGAGAILARKAPGGFGFPKFGAACALWPVFYAFRVPGTPLHEHIKTDGGAEFEAYALAYPVTGLTFEAPPVLQASMLLVARPEALSDAPSDPTPAPPPERTHSHSGPYSGAAIRSVGSSCRVCSHAGCDSRREPSILHPT